MSPASATARQYVWCSPAGSTDQEAPASVLIIGPTAAAASTRPGRSSTVSTSWTSEWMSIVGRHDPPRSSDRRMPPTWTFTYRSPDAAEVMERTSGGPPQGVYHAVPAIRGLEGLEGPGNPVPRQDH